MGRPLNPGGKGFIRPKRISLRERKRQALREYKQAFLERMRAQFEQARGTEVEVQNDIGGNTTDFSKLPLGKDTTGGK